MEKKDNSGMLVGILVGLVIALLVGVCLFVTGAVRFNTATDNGQGSENKDKDNVDVVKIMTEEE